MVDGLEEQIDGFIDRIDMPSDFVVPGANRVSAALDLARTVVRRAERLLWSSPLADSLVGEYLNRLSDLLWATARWTEGDSHLLARTRSRGGRSRSPGDGGRPDGETGPGADGGARS
jgi:cob(I)alamin adenosyltransferase